MVYKTLFAYNTTNITVMLTSIDHRLESQLKSDDF